MSLVAGDDSQVRRIGAIVLAGGESRRFGADKIMAEVDGRTMLDHVLTGLPTAWPVVCVGPPRATARPVAWTREDPPGGGPLAGIAAGEATLEGSVEVVVVVAGDMPWSGAAIAGLVTALEEHPDRVAAFAQDDDGWSNPLLAAYRRDGLVAALPRPAHDQRARLLLRVSHVVVPVPGLPSRDVDTPADLPDAR